MGTTADKLAYLNQSKAEIKQAIIDKGVAISSDTTFREYANKIEEIPSSLVLGDGPYEVKVIDYDGTTLLHRRCNNGDTVTLPNPPSHQRFIFEEWSCSTDIINNTVTVDKNNILCGAIYRTASGKCEFDIVISRTNTVADRTFSFAALTYATSIDWGDGTVNNTTSHIYADRGEYTIKVSGNLGGHIDVLGFYQGGNDYKLVGAFLNGAVRIQSGGFGQCRALKYLTLSSGVTLQGSTTFYKSEALINVTLPNSVTSISSYLCGDCFAMDHLVIPNSITSFSTLSLLSNACSISLFVIPKSITELEGEAFSGCYNLANIVLHNNITDIGYYCFYKVYLMEKIAIPNSVTTIGSGSFNLCENLREVDLTAYTQASTVPTVQANSFADCGVVSFSFRDQATLNKFAQATNWTTLAPYFYVKGEY